MYALAAPAFAAAAVGRQVLATIPVGTARILIVARVPIEDGLARRWLDRWRGRRSSASTVERGGCRVLAVVDDDEVALETGPCDTRCHGGQELLVVATRRGLATSLHRATAPERREEASRSRFRPRDRLEGIARDLGSRWQALLARIRAL